MWLRSLYYKTPDIAALAMTCLATVIFAPSSLAALGDVGFTVGICEKETVLANPGNPAVKMSAMWDTSTQRIMARNMPFLEVTNSSGSTGNLLNMSITIGDDRFNFSDDYYGMYVRPGTSAPAGAIASADAPGGDVLHITFGNGGLAPGQSLIFQIDIGADTPDLFQVADFRTVLFDMNGVNVYDNKVEVSSDDNSEITGTFVDPNDASMTATASTQLVDYEVTGIQAGYFNQHRRPYGQMEGIDIFLADALTENNVIPEPTSLALIGIATCAAIAGYRRRR